MKQGDLPDFRNTDRGNEYLRRIIEEVKSPLDAERLIEEMARQKRLPFARRERDPGEEG